LLHSGDKHDNELPSGFDDTKDAEQEDAEQEDAEQEDAEQEDAEQEDAEQEDAEQEDTEQEDTEKDDGVARAALTSEQYDWPQWLIDGIVQLKQISKEEPWLSLLASFVEFERSLGFPSAVSNMIFDLVDLLKAD
jgi:hypothetical protein